MWLSHLSIKRPYFAFMINLAIIIFGVIAYREIPIANNPNIDLPMVYVNVTYPNASPETEEELILTPLEDSIKGLSGVKSMNGQARAGSANIFVEFNLDISADKAYEDVRTAISTIKLPDGADAPQVFKLQMNSEPIFEIAVSAPKMSTEELSSIIKDNVQPKLQRITGVSNVNLYGDRYREIHIDLKQEALKAQHISPLSVQNTVKSYIFNTNAGQFKEVTKDYTLSVYNIPNNLNAIAQIPIPLNNQNFIHLENIANITNGITDPVSFSSYNGTQSLTIAINKDAQGNIVQTAKDVRATINQLNLDYQNKISFNIIQDDSTFIQNSVNGVKFDILLGSIFAVLIVFLFLHEWKNTLICMIAIPTSLIGTLAIIHLLHFSLNFMTLFALTLCIGIVIDDAIVVVENIHRHRDMGKSPLQAAKDGTDEIGFAAIAVTLAIVSVFIPVAFMKGIIGRFFYEFGITVVVAVMISLFVAFTAVPMFSSKIKDNHSHHPSPKAKSNFSVVFDRYFEIFQNAYVRLIKVILKYRKTTLLSAVLVFIGSIVLLKFVPMMFTVEGDQSLAKVNFSLTQNTSLEVAKERGHEIQKYIQTLPGVENVLMKIGSGQSDANNKVRFTVFLKKKDQRDFTDKEFLAYLTDSLKKFIRNPSEYVGFGGGNYNLQISLLSNKTELLNQYGVKLVKYMETLPDVKGATTSAEFPAIEYRITPNAIQSNLVHVNPVDLANTLRLLFNGAYVGTYDDNGKSIDIKMMLPKENKNTLSDLNSIFIPTQTGTQVLLSSIAKIEKVSVEPVIEHLNGEKVLTVKANYTGSDLAKVTNTIQDHIKETMPPSIRTQFLILLGFFAVQIQLIELHF